MNNIFKTKIKEADTNNNAGGKAYKLSAKEALAVFATTGCFNDTFYTSAESQITNILSLIKEVNNPTYVGKLAIYSYENGFMRDMPAFLLAYLSTIDLTIFHQIFNKIIINGDMLKRFVQIIRSGVVGRKSFGSSIKRAINNWFQNRDTKNLIWDSVGSDPSIGDVIKMTHPNVGEDIEKQNMFKYLLGLKCEFDYLPENVRGLELFKKNQTKEVPNVPLNLLTQHNLTTEQWKSIALNCNWNTLRKNLNSFLKHGVFDHKDNITSSVSLRLKDPIMIQKAKVFPFEIMTTYLAISDNPNMPKEIVYALCEAMEIATKNVPSLNCRVDICVDVSGSMQHSITGERAGATSKCRCIDAAGLLAATILRNNKMANIRPFAGSCVDIKINPFDSIMTNAQKLASIGGGSTYCPAPLIEMLQKKVVSDLIIYISDNESWINGLGGFGKRQEKGTELAKAWSDYKNNINKNAKLICIDIVPGNTSQVINDKSIMNVAGFSDAIFKSINNFSNGNSNNWIKNIESIQL